jgi:SHS2 domain-containing protein
MSKKWEHFAHESDLGVRGVGSTQGEAFEMAAMALTAAVVDPTLVAPRTPVAVSCVSHDTEFLLFDWLNAVIFEMDTRQMIFSQFDIRQINATSLHALIRGERIDRRRHAPAVHVKGATLSELKVSHESGVWIAQCIVDV